MNLFALPFYKDVANQYRYGSCSGAATVLMSAPNRFLPFLVQRPATGQGLDCVLVYDADTGQKVRTIQPRDFPYQAFTDGVFDYYLYFGSPITGLNLACGKYYIEVKDYFSEVFRVVLSTANLLKIEWSNKTDIANIPYSFGFAQRLWLDTALGEPKFEYEEEGEEDGNKVFVPLAHRLAKGYNFDTLPLPAFLIDVLQSLPLHDTVNIGTELNVREFKMSQTWSKDVCTAIASAEFSEQPVLSANCTTPLGLKPIDVSAYVPKPWVCGVDDPNLSVEEPTGNVRCVQADVATLYRSAEIRELVYRDNCGAGFDAGAVTYIVLEGHIVDSTNQGDVDRRARLYFDANKQAYANANAQCVPQGSQVVVNCQYDDNGCFTGVMTDGNGNQVYDNGDGRCAQCYTATGNIPFGGSTICPQPVCQ
jgi:hypothetical protein